MSTISISSIRWLRRHAMALAPLFAIAIIYVSVTMTVRAAPRSSPVFVAAPTSSAPLLASAVEITASSEREAVDFARHCWTEWNEWDQHWSMACEFRSQMATDTASMTPPAAEGSRHCWSEWNEWSQRWLLTCEFRPTD